jgi:site-specific DNA-methyltransferase (adenine-specific)
MPTESEPVVLVQGDCLELLPLLPAGAVDAVVTDPPYGIRRHMQGGTWAKRNVYIHDGSAWDEKPLDPVRLEATIKAAPKVVIWGGNYFNLPPSRCWLVWSKPERNFTMAEAELAWTNIDAPVRVFNWPRIGHRPLHPTQKPVELMAWCMDRMKLGEVILDPFAGSGTTALACLMTGRRCLAIEIDAHYHAVARKRIDDYMAAGPLFEAATAQPELFAEESE